MPRTSFWLFISWSIAFSSKWDEAIPLTSTTWAIHSSWDISLLLMCHQYFQHCHQENHSSRFHHPRSDLAFDVEDKRAARHSTVTSNQSNKIVVWVGHYMMCHYKPLQCMLNESLHFHPKWEGKKGKGGGEDKLARKHIKNLWLNQCTSSSPKECLLLGPGRWGILDDGEAFVDTRINFVSRCILPIKAALASSSCSNLDCNLTWPSSSFTNQATTSIASSE